MPNLTRLEAMASGTAIVLAVALLLSVLVSWGWRLSGPASYTITPSPPANAVSVLRLTTLFGRAPQTPDTPKVAAAPGFDLSLLGLISEVEGTGGYAVFRSGRGAASRLIIAQVGDAVTDDSELKSIEPNEVVLRQKDGGERKIPLRKEHVSLVTTTPAKTTSAKSSRNSCVPADYRGQVVALNSELLQGAAMNPEAFYQLLERRSNGVAVKKTDGFSKMLGLRGGDVLTTANGVALKNVEDIAATIIKPMSVGQNVHLVITRGGKSADLLLVNASGCP